MGLLFAVAWTDAVAVVVAQVNSAQEQRMWTTVLHLAGMVVIGLVGCWIMLCRCDRLAAAEREALHRGSEPGEAGGAASSKLVRERQGKVQCAVCSTWFPAFWAASHEKSVKHQENLQRSAASKPEPEAESEPGSTTSSLHHFLPSGEASNHQVLPANMYFP